MCVSTISESDKDVTQGQIQAQGLVDNHAYTLIGAKEITLDDLSTERLLQVRNPYGMKEWEGDWSDHSNKWTVRTRYQVKGSIKEDGVFFICLKDFLKFFARTTICYYFENRYDNFTQDQHELDQWAATKFTLERDNPNPLVVSIDQISERLMDKHRDYREGSYTPAYVKLILTKLNTKIDPDSEDIYFEQIYQGGDGLEGSHVSAPFLKGLSKGVYLALYQADFNDSHPEHKLIFSVYC